ncbi:MAG: ATP cone domain-containing protein [Candidatus Aenigmatarchaeota archaeon]
MDQIAINVVKRDKTWESFSMQKLVNSCIRAGVPESVAKKVAEEVSKKLYPDIPTYIIRKLIYKELKRRDPESAEKYIRFKKLRG